MKIIQLTAENVKKLKLVEITPKGNFVQVTGKNGQGKTSVLDSIWWALAGEKNIQDAPIRTGAESARVRLDLGDMVVERKFGKGAGLTVRNKTGAAAGTEDKKLPKYDSPQDLLDALVGRLSFDPLAFSKKKPRDQYDELKSVANIELDIEGMERSNATDYAARTKTNAEAKRLRAQADGFTFEHPEMQALIDVAAITAEIQEAGARNAKSDLAARQRADMEREAVDHRAEIERLTKKLAETIKRAKEEIAAHLSAAEGLSAKAAEIVIDDMIDSKPLLARVNEAQVLNREHDRRGEQKRVIQQAERAEAEAKSLTEAIGGREKAVREAIQSAKMPVDGLSLADGKIILNGLPFEQASDAEQLRVSVAIAMAANSKLRVIRIRDGSLLDEEGLALLAELAEERDYQIWLERVDSSGKVGIFMEDGEVSSRTDDEATAGGPA